jgi:hypothetical protein
MEGALLKKSVFKNVNNLTCIKGEKMKTFCFTVDDNIRFLKEINTANYNPFTFEANTLGGASHPSLGAQQTWGNDLANYITEYYLTK